MISSGTKAIIVAAGRGRRLGPGTADIPKCMVKVGGRPILHWQLDALAAAGVRDVVMVRGYLGDRIDSGPFPVRFVDNPAWADNNILASLMYAEAELTSVDPAHDRILQVGKGAVPPESAVGEFIGLAYFSAQGAKALAATWHNALGAGGLEAPFGRAKVLRQAYLTDALNAMADAGEHLAPVYIDGEWREIDTLQDLAAAEKALALWAR